MTCREFEQAWQSRLDTGEFPVGDDSLDAHVASCAACRIRGERYRTLAHALRAWNATGAPSTDLPDRILARVEAEQRSRVLRLIHASAPRRPSHWAAAAALLIAGAMAVWSLLPSGREGAVKIGIGPVTRPTRPLSASLSDATTATLDLALATSTPAARLGRMVLDTAAVAEPLPEIAMPVEPEQAGGLLKSVGDRVATGVKPISGKARRAFSFLLSPTPAEPPAELTREPRRGA